MPLVQSPSHYTPNPRVPNARLFPTHAELILSFYFAKHRAQGGGQERGAMAEEKGSPQKKKMTADEAADEAAASAEAVVRQLAAMGIVTGQENGAGTGAKESQPAAGQGLTAGQVCGVCGGHGTEALIGMREGDHFHSRHTSTHTLQLDMMLQAEHGMFRMQPQEKTQEDFKFWSTQPMLKLGTKNERARRTNT